MDAHTSDTLFPLKRWLKKIGLSEGNPFAVNEADREPFVPECFVDPGIYDRVKNDPRTDLVFAPRGGGKSALRVMLASDSRPQQPPHAHPRSSVLSVTYTDFAPVLSACQQDLSQLTAMHHIAQILGEACAALLEALWQDDALIEALSPLDRSLFADYCRQFNPALLEPHAVYRRILPVYPEDDISWPELRKAVIERQLGPLLGKDGTLPPRLQLYADLVDDVPGSLASSNSPQTLLSEFKDVVQRIGLQAVYILIDRLDEQLLTFRNPDKLAALIAPLLTNLPLMEMAGVAFKFFLPREARKAVMAFVRSERLRIQEVTWEKKDLYELLRQRLYIYSDEAIQSLGKLCDDRLALHIERQIVEMADGSPRRLLQLGAALLDAHVSLSPQESLITQEAWRKVQAQSKYVRPLRVDRQAGQVYLGDTTPVQLTPTPYRLALCLYEGKGFVTKREISRAVWGDEYTTDVTIRQHISQIRKALEEAGANPDHYVVNQPGRGYKLQNTA